MTDPATDNLCPRLLVATEFPPNAAGGGPAVVRQMLRNWPTDRTFWWSCLAERDARYGQKVAAHHVAAIPPKLYPGRRWARQKSWVLENLWAGWASRHLRSTLRKVRPDLVWIIPHAWSIFPLARVLPNAQLPAHVSLHDYPDTRSNIAHFGPRRASVMATMADLLYMRANSRDAICAPMVEDLNRRTGAGGSIRRAGLEPEDFDYLARRRSPATEEIRIAYAGTILVEPEFAAFVSVLNRVREALPKPVRLELLGAHSYVGRPWFNRSWMKEVGNLAEPDLSKALRQCHWGFVPMGITENDPRYNRFSLPTKLVSYLANGLPAITLGHPTTSLIEVARKYKIGICVTSSEPSDWELTMRESLACLNPWTQFGSDIQQCAKIEFDASAMRKALHGLWLDISRIRQL